MMSSRRMRPRVGRVMPEMQFSSVLLPAPLGPINPTIDPDSSAKLTPVKARMPPKSTETSSIARRLMGRAISGRSRQTPRHTPQTLRHEHHPRRILEAAQQFGDDDIECGADDRTADGAEPADHHHAQEGNRKPDAETFGIDVAHQIGKQAPRDRRVKRADGERDHLVARRVDAERAGGDFAVFYDQQRAAGAATAD